MKEKTNKKLFGILNGLDILIILLILAIGAFGVYWLKSGGTDGAAVGEQKAFSYVVEGRQVLDEIANFPQEGGRVFDSSTSEYLGTIKSYRTEPFTEVNFNRVTNKYEKVPAPGYCNIYLEIEGNTQENDEDIIIEGNVVKVGDEQTVKGKGFAFRGYIVEVKEIKEGE